MYDVIKNVIESGRYELTDMLKKIDTIWLQGGITEEQKTELVQLARENAEPEHSYAPLQNQIDTIYVNMTEMGKTILDLVKRVSTLEKNPVEPEPQEEYPPYKQPTGAHDAYSTGDKITFNGKKYVCKMDGCVWSPADYPAGWEEVV